MGYYVPPLTRGVNNSKLHKTLDAMRWRNKRLSAGNVDVLNSSMTVAHLFCLYVEVAYST